MTVESVSMKQGHATAQAVSHWHLTAGPVFSPRSGHVECVVDNVKLGQVSSEYFRFPCQLQFHKMFHSSQVSFVLCGL
jgi:hypothetical protein